MEDGHELLQRLLVELERRLSRQETALLGALPLAVVRGFLLLPHLDFAHTLQVRIGQETCHRDSSRIVRRHD